MGVTGDISILGASLAVWPLVLYSLRVALVGDPLCLTVARADGALLQRVGRVVAGDAGEVSEAEAAFLRRFTRLGLLEMAASLAEVAVLVYLLVHRLLPWLACALLAKNFALLLLNMWYVRRNRRGKADIFEQLRTLPAWYRSLDRGSALLSALGLLAMFLAVNGFLGGAK
jgi:hypothetical protein